MLRKHVLPAASVALTIASLGCDLSPMAPDIVPDLKRVLAIEQVPVSVAASVQGPTCVAPGSVVSWWPGEDNFDDVAGTNPILRTSGVAFAPGVVGQGFRLDQGLGQPFMEIDDAPDLRLQKFTIDFWAQRFGPGQNPTVPDGNILLQKAVEDAGTQPGAPLSYTINWRPDDKIVASVFFEDDDGVPIIRLVGTSDHPFGLVVHVALTFDAATAIATLYVNGAPEATFDASGRPPVVYGGGSLVIGATFQFARNAGFPRSPDGIIDELEILDVALGAAQIQEIYQTNGACKVPQPDPEPEPEPEPEILLKDTFIRKDKAPKSGKSDDSAKSKSSKRSKKSGKSDRAPDNRHTNEGANPRLELSRDEQVLLAFDVGDDFDFSNVTSAQVILTIDPSLGSTGWGRRGRNAMIHPLRRDFVEGNGINTGPEAEQFRGTGEGATWVCAGDQDISNNKRDCSRRDRWQGARKRGRALDRVRITNDQTGTVSFDVTRDLKNGRTRWVIHVDGRKDSGIVFFSQEGAAVPSDAPQLVITTGGGGGTGGGGVR